MPVHNALPFLDAAIESILGQTFRDFEFVILDDASTDGSTERLREWASKDSRIRLLEETRNLGPAVSSERVARAARAPIVARMDADDISYPTRLGDQVKVLDDYPEVGVVGGLYDIIDARSRKIRGAETWRLFQPASIPPFGNGPLMYRREVFERAGGYRPECEFWEDHDLIIRMSAVTRIMVVPRAIYQVRQSPVSTRFASEQLRVERALDLMYQARDRLDQNKPYDDLLNARSRTTEKVDPRVFISLGSTALWDGGRPRMLKRLLQRGRLGLNYRSLSALAWAGWAWVEPRSLRGFIRLLLLGRNLRTSRIAPTDGPVPWAAVTPPESKVKPAKIKARPERQLSRPAAESPAENRRRIA